MNLAREPVGHAPYRGRSIPVHASLDPPATDGVAEYFYSPFPTTALATCSPVRQSETSPLYLLLFFTTLWSAELHEAVVRYLADDVGVDVSAARIEPMPPGDTWMMGDGGLAGCEWPNVKGSCSDSGYCFHGLVCSSLEAAEAMTEGLNTRPEAFDGAFTLRHVVTRNATIGATGLLAVLDERFPGADSVLLTLDDVRRLIRDIADELLRGVYDGRELGDDDDDDDALFECVKDALVVEKRWIDAQSPESEWDRVFWSNERLRPDRLAASWNGLYAEAGVRARDTVVASFETLIGGETTLHDTEAESVARKVASTIEWDGERFVAKAMTLYQVNLANVRDAESESPGRYSIKYPYIRIDTPVAVRVIDNEASVTDEASVKDEL